MRTWACLLAVALALSLAPGTAVAQQDTTPPSVIQVERTASARHVINIRFDEALFGSVATGAFTVTVDGDPQAVQTAHLSQDGTVVVLVVSSPLPAFARIVVTYDRDANPNPLAGAANNQLGSFTRDVTVSVSTEDVYEALTAYFSGTGTFSGVEGVVRAGEGKSYHQKLTDLIEAGGLHERPLAGERTKWGTDGSLGWHQVGTPSLPPGPSDTCGGKTVPGGVETLILGDGQISRQGGLQDADRYKFFWACSQDGQWVPVKLPQPGVDYAYDHQLETGASDPAGSGASQFERDCKANQVMKWDPIRDTCIYHPANQYTGSSGG